MTKKTAGIHHISAIVGNPQENIDFYAGVLGLRFIKQTVNFDDPSTYHLYFGNFAGAPGTIITFFPWNDAYKGEIGDGQVGVTTYVIPKGAIEFWMQRLTKFDIAYKLINRFGETYLQFDDVHGLHLELVEREEGALNNWTFGEIQKDVAIKGFGGAVLYSSHPEATAIVLEEIMGLEKVAEEGDYIRYQSTADIGNIIDLKRTKLGVRGTMGVGTVHHIAWRAVDDTDHLEWKSTVRKSGMLVTAIKDRNYFNALYFREPGQILFEIATDLPGFTRDESLQELGTHLMLPPQYEQLREQLQQKLIPIQVRALD